MAASNASTSAATNTAERELIFTRVFDTPRELLFEAWTDPKHVAQWRNTLDRLAEHLGTM